MPPFGAPAMVEIERQFEPALHRIEKHSHLWVLAWLMDRAERDVLQVTPRGVDRDAPDALHGVFSVRSPARPNPIGLTAARVKRIDGLSIHFDLLDFLDGTPVLDIKPYFVSRDMIYAAHNAAVGRPRDRQALRESLLFQAHRLQPERHPGVALAVRIAEHFRSEVMNWVEPADWHVETPLSRPYLAGALLGITRVSPGTGLHFIAEEKVVLNRLTVYVLKPGTAGYEQILAATDDDLFQVDTISP